MLAIFCTCIFLIGGVYTPYSPCMSTPLAVGGNLPIIAHTSLFRPDHQHVMAHSVTLVLSNV